MENEKLKRYTEAAEFNLDYTLPENPVLNQVYALRGIGYAVLALVELLKEIKDENNN